MLIIPSARWASLASGGSLVSKRSNVFGVNMFSPDGWRIVFVGSWLAAWLDSAPLASREKNSAESISVVVFKSLGLEQPGESVILFAKFCLELGTTSKKLFSPAGAPGQLQNTQLLFHKHPPWISPPFAVTCESWDSFRCSQVALLWPHCTLYPCDQQ